MEDIRKPDGYWDDFKNVKNEGKKYNTRTDFQIGASAAYNKARKNGWLDVVCEHMKADRKPHRYWTRKTILAEAKKYKTLKEFRAGSSGAHDAAYNMGLMPELHRILKTAKKPNGYWTYGRVHEEAKKYTSRMQFMQKSSSAYTRAHKMGWLDKVCSHM
jgi:hypothetical protein